MDSNSSPVPVHYKPRSRFGSTKSNEQTNYTDSHHQHWSDRYDQRYNQRYHEHYHRHYNDRYNERYDQRYNQRYKRPHEDHSSDSMFIPRNKYQKRDKTILRRELFQEKIDDIRSKHPFPNDIHLLQNESPQKIATFTESCRTLDYDSNEHMKQYAYRLDKEIVTVNHFGQRKLLLSEIEFLTLYTDPSEPTTIVYAGAGPGNHTNHLADLFPNVHFVLIDPLPREEWVAFETDRIEIHYDYMTNEIAKQFSSDLKQRESADTSLKQFRASKDRVLFISDIRNTKHSRSRNIKEHEENIVNDNQLQLDWHNIIQPTASMLKFRCPFYQNDVKNSKEQDEEHRRYEYLDGDIYLPVWGKVETCECRLVVRPEHSIKMYDKKKFEEKMMYFNTSTRVQYYEHDMDSLFKENGVLGIDHCYDCRSELWIIENYLKKHRQINDEDQLRKEIIKMVKDFTPRCSKSGRSLELIEHIGLEIGKDIPILPSREEKEKFSAESSSS